jgi:hypothetical protein
VPRRRNVAIVTPHVSSRNAYRDALKATRGWQVMAMNRRYWLSPETERMVRITALLSSAQAPDPRKRLLSRNPDVLFLRREPPQLTHPGHEPALDALTGFYLE